MPPALRCRPLGRFGFLCEQCQRRLQAVRKIAGLGHCPLHGLVLVIEEGVQVIDERLHFCRVGAVDPPLRTGVDCGQPGPELRNRGQAPAHVPQACRKARNRENRACAEMGERAVDDDRCLAMAHHDRGQRQTGDDEEAGRPEQCPEKHAGA